MTGEIFGGEELTRVRVDSFEHLGVLVVGHRLGGIELTVEKEGHVERLLDDFARSHPELFKSRGQLELVAKAPRPDSLPFPILGSGDARIGPGNLKGSRTLEDLTDVDDSRHPLPG